MVIENFEFKKFKKNIHNGSQIVHKNVTNPTVKIVSELESRVKNYRGKTKKQKDGSACMHVSSWREMEVGTWMVGWL
jgi:hypothetical protein